MKYLDCKNYIDSSYLKEASDFIKDGKLVIFPTETVYGIGANGLNENAVKNIFIAKNRCSDNPLILHVSNLEMIKSIAESISDLEHRIINKFFPGPLTLILKKKNIVPNIVSGGLDTVGVRMPSNRIAHDLIELSGVPIAAPSANISGKPSGTCIDDIYEELKSKVDYIIDGGITDIGVESTVIRVIENEIHILRPGMITVEDLKSICENVIVDKHILDNIKPEDKILSPGMKYRHYAPNSKCLLVFSKNENKLINKIKELEEENSNSIVLCKNVNVTNYKNAIGMGDNLSEISKNIFRLLRKVDSYNKELVIIEGVNPVGLGLAIMNRLIRACSHNYIEL